MSSNEKKLPSILESFVIAFSMYSRIPMPFVEWSERGMKYAFCFFPLIGVVIGACVCAFFWRFPFWERLSRCSSPEAFTWMDFWM